MMTIELALLPDWLILMLYEYWSEETWRASFHSPSPAIVADFREWLAAQPPQTRPLYEDYETEMLREFRRQETEASR